MATAPATDMRTRDLVAAYLRDHPVARLHLGAGHNQLPGWLNSDFPNLEPGSILLDATRRFPLPDASLDYIFSEHMIEHLSYPGAMTMLGECVRVLKPGGVMRISTPDLMFLIQLLRRDRSELEEAYIRWAECVIHAGEPVTAVGVFNNFVRAWGHRFIFDQGTLVEAMKRAGFGKIVRRDVGESRHADLAGIDNDDRMPPGFLALESMVFEATRPAA